MKSEQASASSVFQKLFPGESPKNSIFLFLILLAYFAVGSVGMMHHEMWRDEIEPWLIASMSSSLSEFFQNMKMGSNPYVWYLILHFLSKISLSTGIVQVAHLLVATGAVYLVLRYAPFTLLQKLLLCMGYYLVFEYGMISRGYSLTVFFIFLFCVLYKKYWSNGVWLAAVLFFLANSTGGFGAILSIAFLMFLGADYWFKEMSDPKKPVKVKNFGWTIAGVIFSIWVAIKSISPPEDSVYANFWFKEFDAERAFKILWRTWTGYIPVPDLGAVNFWNTSVIETVNPEGAMKLLVTLFSVGFILFGALLFAKRKSVLVFFLAGTCGILLFSYLNGAIYIINGTRYNGFMFLVFVVSYWLMSYYPEKKKSQVPVLTGLRDKFNIEKYSSYFVLFLFSANSLAGIVAYSKDLTNSFSSVESAGKYIVENKLDQYPMAGMIDYAVSPISAFTRKPIFYPERNASSTFPIWSAKNYTTDNNQNITRLLDFISKQQDTVLVAFNFDLNTSLIGDVHFNRVADFKGSVVADENFTLYLASKFDLDRDISNLPAQLSKEQVMSYLNLMGGLFQQNNIAACDKILSALGSRVRETSIPRYHMYQGMLYAKKGNLIDAKREFASEISLNLQKDEAYFQLGMLYYQEQKMDSALFSWEESVKLNPNNPDAFSNLGVIYFNFKKDYPKAGEAWQRAIQINPRYFQVYINLMMNCQAMNDENCMVTFLKAALTNGMSVEEIRSKGIAVSDQLLARARQ